MKEPLLVKADCLLVCLFCTFFLNVALSSFQPVHYNTQVEWSERSEFILTSNPRDEMETGGVGCKENDHVVMWFNQDLSNIFLN